MKRIDLMNACYQIRNSNKSEWDKIEQLRKIAKDQAMQENDAQVVYHWSEHSRIKMNIKPFFDANRELSYLNWAASRDENRLGYYKTKLDIYFVCDNELCSYECMRYDIGCDDMDLIEHIKSYRKNDKWLSDNDKSFMDKAINVLSKVV